MDTKNIVISIVAVLGLLAGSFALLKPSTPTPQSLGSVASPNITSPYLCVNGICDWYSRVAIAATSSVIASIPFPANVGTSTVEFADCSITANGMTGTQLLDISTSTTPFGSSTPALIYAHSIASGAKDNVTWEAASTTNARLIGFSGITGENQVYGTSSTEYLNFRVATGTPGTFASYFTGECSAEFNQL